MNPNRYGIRARPPPFTAFPSDSPALAPRGTDLPGSSTILLSEQHLIDHGANCFPRDRTTSIWVRNSNLAKFPLSSSRPHTSDNSDSCFLSILKILAAQTSHSRIHSRSPPHHMHILFPSFEESNSTLTCEISGLILSLSLRRLNFIPDRYFNYHDESTSKLTRTDPTTSFHRI